MINIKNVENNINVEQLLKETNEILVQNFEQEVKNGTHKPFNVVDLWKLEKQHKSAHVANRWLN
jgi:hypothetical protein